MFSLALPIFLLPAVNLLRKGRTSLVRCAKRARGARGAGDLIPTIDLLVHRGPFG